MTSNYPAISNQQLPLVLTLDIGSSSVRCHVYDSFAQPVNNTGAKRSHCFKTDRNGSSTINPDHLIEAVFDCIDDVLEQLGSAAKEIACVGTCTFVTNILGIDDSGKPLTPLTTYADTVSWPQAERLAGELDQESARQRVGCYFHPSYLPSRFLLWKETDPSMFSNVARWITLGEYLDQILFGLPKGSGVTHSVASWTGLLNRHTLNWDEQILNHLSIDDSCLSSLIDAHEPRMGLRPQFAARWPALANIPWLPAMGDGAAANLGSEKPHCPHTVAITLGSTAAIRAITREPVPCIPKGLWCYRVDKDRLLPGGALTEGGNVYAWLRDSLQLDTPNRTEKAIAAMKPDAHGLTFLPFFAGERSPGWRGKATATIHGITLATQPLDMLHSGMESVAFRLGLIFERLLALLPRTNVNDIPIVAGGGALAASPAWTQILADVLGRDVELYSPEDISSKGVALFLLKFLGTYCDSHDPKVSGTVFRPSLTAHEIYQKARHRQNQLYETICKQDNIQNG